MQTGFGGKFGVHKQTDKSAHDYEDGQVEAVGTSYEKPERPKVRSEHVSQHVVNLLLPGSSQERRQFTCQIRKHEQGLKMFFILELN